MQFAGFVKFLDDDDAVFGGNSNHVHGVDELLKLGAAFAGGVERDGALFGEQRRARRGGGGRIGGGDGKAFVADDDGADFDVAGHDDGAGFFVDLDAGFGGQDGDGEALHAGDEAGGVVALIGRQGHDDIF